VFWAVPLTGTNLSVDGENSQQNVGDPARKTRFTLGLIRRFSDPNNWASYFLQKTSWIATRYRDKSTRFDFDEPEYADKVDLDYLELLNNESSNPE